MAVVSAESFQRAVERHPMVLALFHDGETDPATAERLEAVRAATGVAAAAPWHLMEIEAAKSAELVAMWGLEDELPALVVLREEIALYRSPLAAVEPAALGQVIERAGRLDMARVKAEIEEQRRNRAAIFERRVCPTARRGPGL